jgi:hypothetical protein
VSEHHSGRDGSEDLIHRFLDGELSSDERVQMLVRLGRDRAFREQAVELEQLMAATSRLPRPVVPPGFTARVLAQTVARRSPWQRVRDLLWAPHVLHWNLAGAAALACVALILAGTARLWPWQPATTPEPGVAVAAPSSRVLVRLVVLQPDATSVEVAGDFNGWNPRRTPLERTSAGAWTVTIPLEPGRYEYMFVVDGNRWVADPFAVEQNDDGFGSQNAVLDVRPAAEASL